MTCDHNHVLLVLQFGAKRSIALSNTLTIGLSICKTNSLQGGPDGSEQNVIFAVFLMRCLIYLFFMQYLIYIFATITGDIDILRDFIHDIRYLANILSNNQYLTPPHQPPSHLCWNNGDNSSKFLQIFSNSKFQPQK